MSVHTPPPRVEVRPNGSRLVFMRAAVKSIIYPAHPPAKLAHATVYLLTDFGGASACLSFTDEMLRFPGVTQIGAETHIDRLPSGLAFVRMGRMVREERRRGENETWRPTYRFPGDIADTEAVKRWILDDVVPHGRD